MVRHAEQFQGISSANMMSYMFCTVEKITNIRMSTLRIKGNSYHSKYKAIQALISIEYYLG